MGYIRNQPGVINVDAPPSDLLHSAPGGFMKDIHEVLRRKQAQYAQLAKQIEALQAAADKLREVAPLLSEGDEEAPALDVVEGAEEQDRMSAKAGVASSASVPASKPPVRSAPRWP